MSRVELQDGMACCVAFPAAEDEGTNTTNDVTTLMFRNLPRKSTNHDVVAALTQHVSPSTFDLVYVPQDRKATCNMGFAFVNFIDASIAGAVWTVMEGTFWPRDPRRRKMKIAPAVVQGFAPNLLNYVSKVSKASLAHCPLVLSSGKEVPFHCALQQVQTEQAWQASMQVMQQSKPPSKNWQDRMHLFPSSGLFPEGAQCGILGNESSGRSSGVRVGIANCNDLFEDCAFPSGIAAPPEQAKPASPRHGAVGKSSKSGASSLQVGSLSPQVLHGVQTNVLPDNFQKGVPEHTCSPSTSRGTRHLLAHETEHDGVPFASCFRDVMFEDCNLSVGISGLSRVEERLVSLYPDAAALRVSSPPWQQQQLQQQEGLMHAVPENFQKSTSDCSSSTNASRGPGHLLACDAEHVGVLLGASFPDYAYGDSSWSRGVSSPSLREEPLASPCDEAVLASSAYRAAWLRVNRLLGELQRL